MRQTVCVRMRALEHRYHLSRSLSLLSLVLENFIYLLICLTIYFPFYAGKCDLPRRQGPSLLVGVLSLKVSLHGYHIFYDYSVLFLTMTCNTWSVFQAWENEIV